MAKTKLDLLVNGGKATAAPPIGPALGPLGLNIGQVIADINKKTEAFGGMQVPVTLEVDEKTKEYTISVGTPPASELIKKEANITKCSSSPKDDFVADLKIEQVIKISKMKEDNLMGKTPVARVKEILGTCAGVGVMCEGRPAKQLIADINNGQFVDKINSGKTEISAEELKALEEEKKHLQEELAKKRAEFEVKADEIVKLMEGKTANAVKKKMIEAGIPESVYASKLPKK
jgi:large subunit ribosomal protein L11